MKIFIYLGMALGLAAAPPSITELQPRGAQKGRPFTLTIAGQNLGEGARIVSAMPATFTPMAPPAGMAEGRYATFLVEPKGDLEVGVYPLRVQSGDGLSNILLFSVGAFPEINEEESQPGGVAHSNDSIEKAQSLPTTAITLNGTLRGAERDVYRLQVKAGERRVFEVDARRAGSAIDPVIRVMDGTGKQIARSEDAPLLNLDPRLDMTFPAAGYYYVEIHDARFSGQAQNFYRLKTGAYAYPTEVYPLGGQRGKQVEVSLGAAKVKADLAKADEDRKRVLAEAGAQATKIIEEARAAAAKIGEIETQRAVAAAADIIAKAKQANEAEFNRMRAELRKEVGRLVVAASVQVTGKILSAEDRQRLAQETQQQFAA